MDSVLPDTGDQRQRKEVSKQPRGKVGLPPWALLIFCIPFLAIGIAAVLAGAGIVPVEKLNAGDVPGWVMSMFGSVFILIGTVVAVTTFQTARRKSKAKRAPASIVYKYEHSWSQEGVGDDTGSTIIKTMANIVMLGAFLVPFHGILYYFLFIKKEDGKVIAYIFLGIFDFIILSMVLTVIYLVIRRLIFGRRKVLFSDFPYYLGQNLAATFDGGKKLRNLPQISIVLRCIEEVVENRSHGSSSSPRIACYLLYEDKIIRPTDTSGRANISFELPQDIPGTQLIKNPPIYWELAIKADLPGMDYQGVFLMPVYSP